MKKLLTLADLKLGEKAVVKSLLAKNDIRRRLQDIGLIDNTNVKCLLKSPSGDPTAYLIRGAIIALRKEDAKTILIEYV